MGISRHAASQGFTLIELLIALTISAMLLGLLSQAYFMVTRQWEERFESQFHNLEQSRQLFLLRRSIAYAIPYVPPKPSYLHNNRPLFKGTPESALWVTSAPVFFEGPTLVRLQKSSVSADDAVWEYMEWPHESMFTSEIYPDENHERSKRMSFITKEGYELRYYGYVSFNQRLRLATDSQPQQRWHERFDSTEAGLIPSAFSLLDTESQDRFLEVTILTNDLKYTYISE